MKLLQIAAIGTCFFASISLHAQQTGNDTATKFTPPVIEKDADAVVPAEGEKKEYKSKEWRRGDEKISDTTSGFNEKRKMKMKKKPGKRSSVPPPPPPPALPPNP